MRTGLFGGTFDPIHTGHIIIAETVRSDFPLDRILFIPVGIPPHKENTQITPAQMRYRMVELAVNAYPYFAVSDCEIRKKGISYTIDTVRSLKSSDTWGKDDFYLIIGMDSLLELNTWKKPEALLREIDTILVGRPGFDIEAVDHQFRQRVALVQTPLVDISSTEIRRRVREGKSIRTWVPDAVETYIREKGLYL